MVSVIIPVYNGEKYIESILNNLSNQVFKDFEVVFIDDGSIDKSYDLLISCKESNKYFFRMNVIKQGNKGVSNARNTGIVHAKGKYICFVDVDDGILPEYLSYMHQIIKKENASIVICKTTSKNTKDNNKKNGIKIYSNHEALIRYLNFDLISGACTLMVSSNVIQKNGLKFAEGYKYSEDLHMVWRMIYYSDIIVESDKQLYTYNVNEGSAMSKFDDSRMDSVRLMEDLEGFFESNSPEFYPIFKKYGKARMMWSLLWQASYHYKYKEFRKYIRDYDFRDYIKNLFDYKQKHVALSSILFYFSEKLYYLVAKVASKDFRSS